MHAAGVEAPPQRLHREFVQRFGAVPTIFQAPGRVNLIGEHTDYNQGFVLPAAIGFKTRVARAHRSDGRFRVRSVNLDEEVTFEPGELVPRVLRAREPAWFDYIAGVVWALRERGVALRGADLLIDGEVPLGSGLSSSAALELAVAVALLEGPLDTNERVALALACQHAENDYVGARCGIMDQYTAACGRAGHALLLDCRSLESRLLPLESAGDPAQAFCIVVCNTLIHHRLSAGEYNHRREQCERAVAILARQSPEVKSLRDVSAELLETRAQALGPLLLRRARHVIAENARVLDCAAALVEGDLERFGQRMYESHASLRDDFEVSCRELDVLVELASELSGVFGSRMMGGGFGGCTVSLVRRAELGAFEHDIDAGYRRRIGWAPAIYVCASADGAGRVETET